MKDKNWIVKAFHTRGPYKVDADKLKASADKFGVPLDIEVVNSTGSWNTNTHYKPVSILNAMEKYPNKNIWHVDVDTWFMQYPALFDQTNDWHIAAFYFGSKKTWCSGTIFCVNDLAVRNIIDDWNIALRLKPRQHGDQVALGKLLDNVHSSIRVGELPAAYLQGLSKHLKKGQGVIAHDGARKRYVGTDIYAEPA